MYWKLTTVLVIGLCSFMLHQLNQAEQKGVYKQCLIEYNYSELENRFAKANSAWTKQRIQFKAIQAKSKCNKRAKEHFSI